MTPQAPDTRAPRPLPPVSRRDPAQVMRLSRLGALHQSRLSFMRILLRRMASEQWRFEVPVFDIDASGVGHAVLCAHGPERSYSLVAFAHDLPAAQRSDRVIATAWDATFTLFDGVPTAQDIKRLSRNVPLQEAGRISQHELTLARANRSVRLWDHVVGKLASGNQPDADLIDSIGYLMRTTAVYGSGKFGAADREDIARRPECAAPFQVEMLTVYLIRDFVGRLVNHMARAKGGAGAVGLDPALRRRLGIGNSTGLGMAPFLINHPDLLNNWIMARETALARVRNLPDTAMMPRFERLLDRARRNADLWTSDHAGQQVRLTTLRADLTLFKAHLDSTNDTPRSWDGLFLWAQAHLEEDAQEQIVSLMIEPHGSLVDDLATSMASDTPPARIDGAVSAGQMRALLTRQYGWALDIDWHAAEQTARVWYVSAEKLEPRLGERALEPIAPYEQPLAPARDMAALDKCLGTWPEKALLADVLLAHPEHRHAARRAQLCDALPYGELHDNTVHAAMQPIDMLRCKLSFFGAGHFDPRSDRWVRINMFRFAPLPDELATMDPMHDDWAYPL
ncbi:MAG: hypothetical protein ACJA1F_000869 [Paracoccaceae bacterium]|jgi:hypothetical protein